MSKKLLHKILNFVALVSRTELGAPVESKKRESVVIYTCCCLFLWRGNELILTGLTLHDQNGPYAAPVLAINSMSHSICAPSKNINCQCAQIKQ